MYISEIFSAIMKDKLCVRYSSLMIHTDVKEQYFSKAPLFSMIFEQKFCQYACAMRIHMTCIKSSCIVGQVQCGAFLCSMHTKLRISGRKQHNFRN